MHELANSGHLDVAYELLLREEYPSWLYPITMGATTIWERWDSWSEEEGFGDVGMNSFNHYAFGAVCEWMFESLAGIKPGAPGFQTLEVDGRAHAGFGGLAALVVDLDAPDLGGDFV